MTSRASRLVPAAAFLGLLLPVLTVAPVGAASATILPVRAQAPAEEVGYAQVESWPQQVLLPQTPFAVSGRLGNKLPRTVELVHASGGATRTVATTTSTSEGLFTFSGVRVSATGTLLARSPEQTLRVQAGEAAHERHRLVQAKVRNLVEIVRERKRAKKRADRQLAKAARGTSARKMGKLLRQAGKAKIKLKSGRKALARARAREVVTRNALVRTVVVRRAESRPVAVTVVASQSSTVAALPPVAQPGASAAAPPSGAVVSAGFVPARPGRTVRLERLEAGTWRTVTTQAQDRSGHAVFGVDTMATYRAVAPATAEAAEVVTASVTTTQRELDFSDTFDGTELDPGKWQPQKRPLATGLRTCAHTDGSSYRVGGGVLRLGVSKDPSREDACPYVDADGVEHALPYMRNTQIASLGRYSFRYGVAAARIKVQPSVGMHSAFWSQPVSVTVPGRPDLGSEVDVMEYFGDYPRDEGIATFQHVLQQNGTTAKHGRMFPETALMKGPERFSANYHVYSVEWTPDEYVFRVDGREYHRTDQNVSRVEQFLLLSMLTSSYELVRLENFDDVASVDWVRVWK